MYKLWILCGTSVRSGRKCRCSPLVTAQYAQWICAAGAAPRCAVNPDWHVLRAGATPITLLFNVRRSKFYETPPHYTTELKKKKKQWAVNIKYMIKTALFWWLARYEKDFQSESAWEMLNYACVKKIKALNITTSCFNETWRDISSSQL